MALEALIKFTQAGGATDVAGRAVIGVLDPVVPANDVVTVTNIASAEIVSWSIDLLYVPPGSGLSPGNLDAKVDNTPTAPFTPDVPGCYRVMTTVSDGSNTDVDIRNFAIKNRWGVIIPPYQKNPDPIDLALKPDELNFDGQAFGWVGDRSHGLHEEFFSTLFDVPFYTISTGVTFNALPLLQEQNYLVDLSAVGADFTFNLQTTGLYAGMRTRVHAWGSSSYVVTVNPPGGHNINGLSSVVLKAPNVLDVVYLGGNNWVMLGAKYDYYERSLVAGVENVQTTGFQSVGTSILLDPDDFPNGTFDWRVVIETTDALDAAEILLYNVTQGSAVAGTTLSTTNLTPTALSVSGITLHADPSLYEAQLRLQTTGSPNVATCRQAQIVCNWLQP